MRLAEVAPRARAAWAALLLGCQQNKRGEAINGKEREVSFLWWLWIGGVGEGVATHSDMRMEGPLQGHEHQEGYIGKGRSLSG